MKKILSISIFPLLWADEVAKANWSEAIPSLTQGSAYTKVTEASV